jgi:starch-binding outer membrane protein, SusD/RagB family
MRTAYAIALGALLVGGVACSNYLSGPSLGDKDPNSILNLKDPGPLYVGLEAGAAEEYTTQFARFLAMYTQQVAGAARQQQGYDLYVVGTSATDAAYSGFYSSLPPTGGGGAADARKIQIIAQAQHDSIYIGIAKIWEAMEIGDVASIWGAVPYTQAFNLAQFPQPKYDDQMAVLNEVESTLDQAIAYLNCNTAGATNIGPNGLLPKGVQRTSEIIYGGAATSDDLVAIYKEVAHTLKARFYLHMAEAQPANYAKALAEARLGISTTDHDWNWYANTATGPNQWISFQGARGDLAPASAMIHLMKARIASGKDVDNGRFAFYFTDANGDPCDLTGANLLPDQGCTGIRPGFNSVLPDGDGNSSFALFNGSAGSFRQPAVTYTENQLIIAEAALHAGNQVTADSAFNNVRANETYGADALDGIANCTSGPNSECTFTAQPPIVNVTLQDVIEEKYIDLFVVPEVFNDYKRTCLPYLSPAPASPSSTTPQAAVPGRLPYGQTAISSDPNTPNVGATARNANDPNPCPLLTYTSTPAAW